MSRKVDKDLLSACINGKRDDVERLIKEGANVRVKYEYWEQTPLHLAAWDGNEHVVSALLSHGGDHNVADNNGQTPLHLAANYGHEPVVSALLFHGGDHNVADNNGRTPLHLAAYYGHEPVVLALLSHGVDPNVADNNGQTPLHLAAGNGKDSVVSALLSHGADCNVADKMGHTPLHLAAVNGKDSVVSALLSHGADCNVADEMGATPLHWAVGNDNGRGVSALLFHGADPNVADKSGATPLHMAAVKGRGPVVSALLSHGADPNVADKSGATPLHLAARKGHRPVVSALLSNGADPNVADKSGATPLHWAAMYDYEPVVSALLSHGADPNVADKSGQTPYDVCGFFVKRMLQEALQFPRELQYLSVQDDETFTNILKSGYYESHVGKLMCVGPEGVGKTAIVSVLRDVKPSETRIPTEGVDLHTYKAAINTGTMEWVPSELKAEDVAIRDLLLEPKRKEQVSPSKFDYDDHLSHYSERVKNEQVNIGASPLDKSEDSRKKVTVKPLPSNQNIAKKDAIDRRGTKEINQPRKDEPKYKSIYLLKEVQQYAKSKKGLLERALAPVNMMDFGGQAAFYSTHQSFLTYRGLYVLVLDGSKGFDEVIDTEDFIPGRHGKPTARKFTFFWVSSILAYSKGASKNFPKILVVLTHKDKVPSNEADQKAEQIFLEIEQMFSNTPAEKHLILKPRLFLNAMDPNDPGYSTLKEVLVEQMCCQPSWGEKLPKAWIPLKMIINQKVEQGEMIMSLDELQAVNEQNPVQKLSERELAIFMKIHHAQGEIIHSPIEGLKDRIIISPEFLVDALKSLVTDERFCHGERRRTLESINQNGLLRRPDIESIWEREERFTHHKYYLLSLFRHLDIIAIPRNYDPDGTLQDSDIFYVPSLVKGRNDTDYLTLDFKSKSIGLSFLFHSKILPPAIGYRFIASCIDAYEIKTYNDINMLFSGMVVLCPDRRTDLLVRLQSDRIDIYLVHGTSKNHIRQTFARNVFDCLQDILVNILESFRKSLSEGTYVQDVPFSVEFPCHDISAPCYDKTKSRFTCKHDHIITEEEKEKWFLEKKLEPKRTIEKAVTGTTDKTINELKGEITERQLANLCFLLTKEELDSLVIHHGMKRSEIDAIEIDNPGNLMNIKFQCLHKWKRIYKGSIQGLLEAAKTLDIGSERIYKMNVDKTLPDDIRQLHGNPTDKIFDSVATQVISDSLLFCVYLGVEASFWIDLKDRRYTIVDINREVLKRWRNYYSGINKMEELAKALCSIDIHIETLLPVT